MAGTIMDALRYPFADFKRLFNYWWILTIVGIPAFLGYYIKIVRFIVLKKGKDKKLPKFGSFWENFKEGFPLLLLVVVLLLAIFALRMFGNTMPFGFVFSFASFYLSFIFPVLLIQYAVSGRFSAGCDIGAASRLVFNNLWDYIATIFRVFVVSACYLLASVFVITLVITMPGNKFSQYYLFAQFYKQAVFKK